MFKSLLSVTIAIKFSKMMYELPQFITIPFWDREITGLRIRQSFPVYNRREFPYNSRWDVLPPVSKMWPKYKNQSVCAKRDNWIPT